MADVFISYSRKDKDFVNRLHDALAKINRDTWVDWEGIPPTAEWMKEIYSGIESADTFIFIISPDSVASEICGLEIAHAVKHNKRLVPIVCRDVDSKAVPQTLASLNWIFYRETDDFDSAFQSLIKALDTDLEYVRDHTRLLVRAIEWDNNGRESSFILRGKDLKEAEQWLIQGGEGDPKPTPLQTQYIIASRGAETKRQRTMLVGVTFALIVVMGLALVAFYLYRVSETRRKIATSRQLAAQASNHLDDQVDLALLLSAEAYRFSDTFEARNILLSGLQYSPHLAAFLRNRGDFVSGLAFSPDGKTLASVSNGDAITLWDVTTHRLAGQLLTGHTNSGAKSVAFSPDGKILASAGCGRFNKICEQGEIMMWDVVTQLPVGQPLAGHKEEVYSIAFSPDGKVLASGSCGRKDGLFCGGGEVILWDVTTHQPKGRLLTGHPRPVSSLAFSPDGKVLASGSRDGDGTAILWDVSILQPVSQPLIGKADGMLRSITFSPDGKTLALSYDGDTTVLWDMVERKPLDQLIAGHASDVFSGAFSPDGKTLASGYRDGVIVLWDVVARLPVGRPLIGHNNIVFSIAFSRDGKMLASGSCRKVERYSCTQSEIILWDLTARKPLARVINEGNKEEVVFGRMHKTVERYFKATEEVSTVAFNPDGKTLAAGGRECLEGGGCRDGIRLWDVTTRQSIGEPLITNGMVNNIVFSPDGKMLASNYDNGTLVLWDIVTRQPIGRPLTGSPAFSPDSKTLALGSCGKLENGYCKGEIILWDVNTHQPIGDPLAGIGSVSDIVFNPDGKTLAWASCGRLLNEDRYCKGEIILWDVATRQPTGQPLTGHNEQIYAVAFSPDGKRLVSGSCVHYGGTCEQGEIRLWDLATQRQIGQPLTGHRGIVSSIAFNPDGKMLASGSPEGAIILWDVATRQPLGQPFNENKRVYSLAFSPDGKTLAVASDGLILWDTSLDSWIARACSISNRNLTQDEWRQYVGNEPYHPTCPNLPIPKE